MHSSTAPVMKSISRQSQLKLRVPQVVAGKKPLPLIHSCPVIPKCYELTDSFNLSHNMSDVNESSSHYESSTDTNTDHLHFDKDKFMKLVLTEDWANIF